jgi:hypothetical protein
VFVLQPLGGILTRNLACGREGNNSVVQQNRTEATVYIGRAALADCARARQPE